MTGPRADYNTLTALGLSEQDMRSMGLWECYGELAPGKLMDLYLRRSTKQEDVATLRGHLKDALRYRNAHNLQIRHVWFEQLSASKTYVRRREFENATQAVLDGLSKTLAAWRTDRFDRRGMGAVGRLLDAFETRNAGLVSITEGLDSRQPGARMVFAFLSEKARAEAKDITTRVTVGHREHKELSRRGTGRPPFGTRSPRLENGKPSGVVEPHPEEYDTARRLADMLLGTAKNLPEPWAGEEGRPLPCKLVAHILNAEGRVTRGGHTWSQAAVNKLAQSPLFAGMVPERERVVDEFGNPTGQWRGNGEPSRDSTGAVRVCGTGVITQGEYWRIRELVRSRTNPTFARGKPGAKYLGTGLYRCGRGNPDYALCNVVHRGGRYRCATRQSRGASVCQGCSVLATRIDTAVSAAWMARVTALEPGSPVLLEIGRRWLAFSNPEHEEAKRAAVAASDSAKARLKKLEDDFYLHGRVSEERFQELSDGLVRTIRNTTEQLEVMDRGQDYSVFQDGETLEEAWMEADIPTRRMLLQCTLGKNGVIIIPANGQGDKTPMMDRLVFDWVHGVPQ
ncbi:recombinase family protein [Streptomyces koyangensis]